MGKILYSNAKINIGLNIIRKRKDGYHELEMTMLPIELSDKLEVEYFDKLGNIEINCNKEDIPVDERNIIYKIYNIFFEKTGIEKEKIKIKIEKHIPAEAGLGGGSSNGAFFLNELNNHYGKPLSIQEMIDYSKKVGADIPFFLFNKASIVKGIGEKLEFFYDYNKFKIILIKPNFGVSTGLAYNSVSKLQNKEYANINAIVEGLKNNNLTKIEENIKNTLWQAVNIADKKIRDFYKKLEEVSDRNFFMSGSGSCFYSFIREDEDELVIKQFLENKFKDCFLCITKLL